MNTETIKEIQNMQRFFGGLEQLKNKIRLESVKNSDLFLSEIYRELDALLKISEEKK